MIPAGTQIICPKRHLIGTFNQIAYINTPILPKLINFEQGQERVAGDNPVCSICGKEYIRNGCVYTPSGWMPETPFIEPVMPREMR